jgi:hypothetical protein
MAAMRRFALFPPLPLRAALLLPLALAVDGCGESVKDDHFAKDLREDREGEATARTPAAADALPVRIGELGPSFAACNGAGTPRNLAAGETLPVRSAPFDHAAQTGSIAAASRFFVCTRSHDQRWLGVVYDEAGALDPRCGVAAPVTSRRAYEGPCRSGWAPAASVKLVAG